MRRPLCSSCLALLLAIGVAPASAETAPAPGEKSLTDSLHGPAKDAYASAKLLFNNNDFAGAARKYQQAYELSKDPRLLFDEAICEKNLRAYARMESLLQRYEKEAGPGISAEDKVAVDRALSAIKNLVGTVKVAVSEAGATVKLDGQKAGTTPLDRPLIADLGRHAVAVEKSGFETVEMPVEIAGGSD